MTPRVANRLQMAIFLDGLRDIDLRATRIMLGLSQRDVERMTGVCRKRINDGEAHRTTALELRLFYLAILKGWMDPLTEALGVPPTSSTSSTGSEASSMKPGLSEGACRDDESLRDNPARCKVCGRRLGGRKRKKPRAKRRKPSAGAHTPPPGAGAPG